MARLAIAGVFTALTLMPGAGMAQFDSRAGAPPIPPMSAPMPQRPRPMAGMPPMEQSMRPIGQPAPGGDRWAAVPGGWNAYRGPAYGYTLPRHWIAPGHFIADYQGFGLPEPAAGYGWSRYYDDLVLTDRWGRVYDWRGPNDWGRDMRDSNGRDYRQRKRSGVVGAIIGGAVGALTGNLIAGAGNRLAGSLLGGGVGALAGQAIGRDTGRRHGDYYRDGADGYRPSGPHWFMGDYNGGYYASCGCTPTVTTTYARPVVTRTVTYVTEYVRAPAHKRVRTIRSKDRYLARH
jgi:Nickel/cobalt transporter regulator